MNKIIIPLFVVMAAALGYLIMKGTISNTAPMVEGKAWAEKFRRLESAGKEAGFLADVLGLQAKFLRNNSILRAINDSQGRPDLQKYLNEVNTLMSWYFREPVAELWKAYPEKSNPESVIAEKRKLAQEEGPKKKAAQGNLSIWEECYKMVRTLYDEFKGGKYTAIASDYQGSVRMDVHSVKNEGGKLRWEIVVWGGIGSVIYNGWIMKWFKAPTAEEKKDYEKSLADMKKRKTPALPGQEPKDPATLHFAQGQSGTGHPAMPDFEGAEYILDFPPGVLINYWTMPTCPPEAEKLEVTFKAKCRAMSGEDQEMSFVFNIPVDPSWKGNWANVQKIEAAQ